jgi:hypothetical protein
LTHSSLLERLALSLRDIYTEDRYQVPEQTPRSKRRMDYVMLLLAGVSVGMFVFEMLSDAHPVWLDTVTIAFDCLFLADYVLRTVFSGRRREAGWSARLAKNNYLARWYGIVDIISVAPPILAHVFHIGFSVEEFSRVSRVLRVARAARILRLLRSLRIVRDSRMLTKHVAAFHGTISKELRAALILMMAALTVGGFLLYELEGSSNAHFRSAGEIFYWSVLSLMGQSDGSVFETVYARVVGVGVIFCGVAFLGLVSGSISAFFIDKINKRMSGKEAHTFSRHVVICGWNSRVPELLDHLSRVKSFEHAVIVTEVKDAQVLRDHPDQYLNPHLGKPVQVEWVDGSPRNEAVLMRSRVHDARSVIVMADATGLNDETDVDARTLITVHAIYDCFDAESAHRPGAAAAPGRERPKITVEVLSPQTVRIINNMSDSRKIDHVVYADEIVCQYISMDVDSRSAGDVYRQLFDPTDQNVYLQQPVFAGAFHSIAAMLAGVDAELRARGCVLLGIRVPASQVLRRFMAAKRDAVELRELLTQAGLSEAAGTLLRAHWGVSLQEAIDGRAQIDRDALADLERREQADGANPGLLILNPWARLPLCASLLADRLASLPVHAPFQLVIMAASKPDVINIPVPSARS